MISYPNQKKILIKKEITKGANFIMLEWDDYVQASKVLSPSALDLYMYLAKNQDNYEFYFSPKDFCANFNVADRTYREAKKQLLTKGYIKENEKNKVIFNTKPIFLETKESLKEEFQRLANLLQVKDDGLFADLREKTEAAQLRSIENENVYKIKIKELIEIAEKYLTSVSTVEIEKLI